MIIPIFYHDIKGNIPEFSKEECKNNDHWFIPYSEIHMICKKCGRLVRIRYMQKGGKE